MRSLEQSSEAYNFCAWIEDIILPTQRELEAIYPVGSAEAQQSHVFIVMEYTQKDLRKLLDFRNQTNLTEQHLKVMMYYLLCSLKFLHTANVVHRDIKPSNILINTES